MIDLILNGEQKSLDFANCLAIALGNFFFKASGYQKSKKLNQKSLMIYLKGDLGAGKTTLVRFLLNSLGFKGKVKSPSYSLIEEYHNLDKIKYFYHFDLYRLGVPEEIEFLGIRDYLSKNNSVSIIEWPEKGAGFLPEADLNIELGILDNKRSLRVTAANQIGELITNELLQNISNISFN